MTAFDLLRSPIGPPLTLAAGALVTALLGRLLRRPALLSGLALFFVAVAAVLWIDLRFQPIVPTFSRAWKPIFQSGANLYWMGDGWNWYVAGLMLLTGGLGVLLDTAPFEAPDPRAHSPAHATSLGVNLVITAAAVLFVSSGNLITAVFTWVLLDIMILVRGITKPGVLASTGQTERWYSHARGFSLAGAVLLLMALLPAGPTGPDQSLQGGNLPVETLLLMTAAAFLRSGVYQLHFWLLADRGENVDISERLLDHVAPVLSGLWLIGWTVALGGMSILQRPDVVGGLVLSMLLAAFAAFTTRDTVSHTTFVFVAAAGQCLLAGALFYSDTNPAALLWPATTFALGAALWLVGRRIWQAWRWQLPVSVAALTLAGAPFTPGFLMQPSFASLLSRGAYGILLFVLYVLAQGFLIAALLRSWGSADQPQAALPVTSVIRLLVAAVAIALPLALAGFLPQILSNIVSIPGAIPPEMGTPPSVVAELVVWIPLLASLGIGMSLIYLLPRFPARLMEILGRLGSFLRLDWLSFGTRWGFDLASQQWGAAFGIVEGAGYMGWMLAFLLIMYLLIA